MSLYNKDGEENTSWEYKSETKFWIEKARVEFNRSVGIEQGSKAISSIKVHGTFPKVAMSSLVVDVNS